MKPHKHAELIKAWADGAEIEIRTQYPDKSWSNWEVFEEPRWGISYAEYRIKPEQKPDNSWSLNMTWDFEMDMPVQSPYESFNLKVTFDGETGELKSAEVLK